MRTLKVLVDGLAFPEGPRWHDERFYFSDMHAHQVLAVDMSGKREIVCDVPGRPSGLGWLPDGRLLVVSMTDRKLMRLDRDGLKLAADMFKLAPFDCNDMVVDARGRAYVGNFGFDLHKGETPRGTTLVMAAPDGTARVAAEEMMFPNGSVITPDGKTLIVGETFASRLTAFDIAADGSLGNRRLFAGIEGCWPDGICLDAEGAVWVTNPRGHEVLRVFDGGRIAERISTGERHAYACMLGGDDRRTLCVITNTGSGPAMGTKSDGRVETVRVTAPGAGLP